MPAPEFIVFAAPYNENVGGIVALHALCDRLNSLGASAALWPAPKPAGWTFGWRALRKRLGFFAKLRFLRYEKGPFASRIARERDLRRATVIYPEIVDGNPLGVERVVRWLLYKPGFHGGPESFGERELVFAYNPAFAADIDPPPDLLRVTYVNPVYRQANFGPRKGSCYLVRKGRRRTLDRHPPDAVLVDDMPHAERAAIFNRVEYVYSYDPYTFYVQYAALCGCVPIVIPEDGVAEEQWEPLPERRLGIAYGEQRIQWAKETREALLTSLAQNRLEEDATVTAFVRTCRARFASTPDPGLSRSGAEALAGTDVG